MDIKSVRERMEQKGITVPGMCKELGINPSTWYRKEKNDGDGFNVVEFLGIKRVLELTDQEALDFLMPKNSQECEKGA